MASFVTYRNVGVPIEERIKQAVGQFYTSRGTLPVAVIVNAREVVEAREAVQALSLTLPVLVVGGVLQPEIWLKAAVAVC